MTVQRLLTAFIILTMVGIIGALPAGILGALFGAGWDILLLYAAIIALWLPQKMLADQLVKGETRLLSLLPSTINPDLLPLVLPVSFIFVPFIWSLTAIGFFAGVFGYISFQSLPIALVIGLILQQASVYRSAQIEKQSGNRSNLFTVFENMQTNMNVQAFTIDADGNIRQQGYTTGSFVQQDDDEYDDVEEVQINLLVDENPSARNANVGGIQHEDETVITFDDDDSPDVITLNNDDK